jgi:protein-tyrosine phosphatase
MLLARPNRMQPIYFAFKLKDGLFIGDGQSPNQLDFLLANKIGTIVNCAASEVTVQHQLDGIRIINFEWLDSDDEVILDASDSNFHSICHFIDDAHAKHEGVLVCSLRGQSRALTIITAYLIKKYKWSLYKTLEYLNSKRNDFEIRANFLKQLVQLEARLFGKKLKNCTKNW